MLKFKTHINNKNKGWITFLHGFGGSSNIWHKQVRELSQNHNLLFIDLRGHGKSRNICLYSDFTLVNSCEDIINVLKFLKISVVIAQSFAGIFYRISINLGLPAVVCYDNLHVQDGEIVDFDLKNNQLNLIEKNKSIKLESIPTNLMEILNDGGLIPHLKKRIK